MSVGQAALVRTYMCYGLPYLWGYGIGKKGARGREEGKEKGKQARWLHSHSFILLLAIEHTSSERAGGRLNKGKRFSSSSQDLHQGGKGFLMSAV